MMKVCSGEGRGMSEANRKQGAMSERLATDENRRFEARNRSTAGGHAGDEGEG